MTFFGLQYELRIPDNDNTGILAKPDGSSSSKNFLIFLCLKLLIKTGNRTVLPAYSTFLKHEILIKKLISGPNLPWSEIA